MQKHGGGRVFGMNIHTVYAPFLRFFRAKRNCLCIKVLNLTAEMTVLDVGGDASYWRSMPIRPRVTLLNILEMEESEFPQVVASACDIPYPDKSFDVVFCNSVIEHLGTWEHQLQAAKEMLRVGRKTWVQTPNRWFPIEPHLLTPFIHWLPRKWQRRLIPYTVWAFITKPSTEYCDKLWEEVRLLNVREMKILFPTCKLIRERFGITKSLIAVKVD
jgi:SAM-dependent methyltransferase